MHFVWLPKLKSFYTQLLLCPQLDTLVQLFNNITLSEDRRSILRWPWAEILFRELQVDFLEQLFLPKALGPVMGSVLVNFPLFWQRTWKTELKVERSVLHSSCGDLISQLFTQICLGLCWVSTSGWGTNSGADLLDERNQRKRAWVPVLRRSYHWYEFLPLNLWPEGSISSR